ncbi:adapter molecule Crk-like [Babylonia areolata]|uniref:adapter molecule Crk-like n=1 Tax=Babylonia areolata TaxID=304850 RepID=UPI003FD348A8
MEADFEPEDKYSWYFGPLSREETNDILQNKKDSGVFLVRDSQSIRGDFVLCVKEDNKVSHYIINRIQVGGMTRFKIGDKEFNDIPSLLNFYKSHYLDTTTLIRPAPREKLVGKYDFGGRDPEDLPFSKGDILELISKDEDEWWTARDKHGRVGQIPVKYTTRMQESNGASSNSNMNEKPAYSKPENILPQPVKEMQLPAYARVVTDRNPNAYDRTQLRLRTGEIVKVLATNVNGQWEGEVNGRRGIFPFTHVQFISEEEVP